MFPSVTQCNLRQMQNWYTLSQTCIFGRHMQQIYLSDLSEVEQYHSD
jgi:hypothetical protein